MPTNQESRANDGLPETLSEVIAIYGCRYYKIKIGGDADTDLDRLGRIAALLDGSGILPADGADPALRRFSKALLCHEQPVPRDRALAEPVDRLADRITVIIDESDGGLDAFPTARSLGYTGVSSKTCKGFYKSIVNGVKAKTCNGEGAPRYFLSAEDPICEPDIAGLEPMPSADWS